MSTKGTNSCQIYLLKWLRDGPAQTPGTTDETFDYRLVCSGDLYNADVQTLDWKKSDACRILLTHPFRLVVANSRYVRAHSVPREIELTFRCSLVQLKHLRASSLFHPHQEIASDVAAILTLLCRRLITVAGAVRVTVHDDGVIEQMRQCPLPLLGTGMPSHWPSQPAILIYGEDGIKDIKDYNPPPKPVSGKFLSDFFQRIVGMAEAQRVVLAARLYWTALQSIHTGPDVAYLMLAFAVDTLASKGNFDVPEEKKVSVKSCVRDRAIDLGLSEQQARDLAVEACAGMNWQKDRFVDFLARHVLDTNELWEEEDDLFHMGNCPLPQRKTFEEAVKCVFDARSAFVHTGHPYPVSIQVGLTPYIPVQAIPVIMSGEMPLPPVAWFERVVNIAMRTFIGRQLRSTEAT